MCGPGALAGGRPAWQLCIGCRRSRKGARRRFLRPIAHSTLRIASFAGVICLRCSAPLQTRAHRLPQRTMAGENEENNEVKLGSSSIGRIVPPDLRRRRLAAAAAAACLPHTLPSHSHVAGAEAADPGGGRDGGCHGQGHRHGEARGPAAAAMQFSRLLPASWRSRGRAQRCVPSPSPPRRSCVPLPMMCAERGVGDEARRGQEQGAAGAPNCCKGGK